MGEPAGDQGAGHAGDQQPAPLHRHVLENDQVNRQGTQPRAGREGGARHAGRARRDMRRAAGAADLVQVVPDPLRGRGRDLFLLEGPGNAQVSGVREIAAARAGASGEVVPGPVRDLPRHGRALAARLPSRLLPPGGPLRGPPLPPRRLPPRLVIRAGRHPGVPAVPRQRPQRPLQLLPQAGDHRFQRGDPLRPDLTPCDEECVCRFQGP